MVGELDGGAMWMDCELCLKDRCVETGFHKVSKSEAGYLYFRRDSCGAIAAEV